MKLYATVRSERASKGQGGNEFLDIIVLDDNREEVMRTRIEPFSDSIGDGLRANTRWAEHVYVNDKQALEKGTQS